MATLVRGQQRSSQSNSRNPTSESVMSPGAGDARLRHHLGPAISALCNFNH